MAVIGKLRSYNYLVVLAIAVALVLFLMMDIIPNFNLLSQDSASNIGVVDGTKITNSDFQEEYNKQEKVMISQNQNQPISDQQQHQLRNQIWSQMGFKILTKKVYDKLGIQVSGAEIKDMMMGENADENIKRAPAFINEMGMFDPTRVEMYVKNLDRDEPGTPPGAKRAQWSSFEKAMIEERNKQKFNALITKAAFVPTWQANMEVANQTKTADANYVMIPYSTINDKDITVTDDELKAYLTKNENKFKQMRDTRKVKYALFNIAPSSADSQFVFGKISEIKTEFEKAENDSIFIKSYDNNYNGEFKKKEESNPVIADQLFASAAGSYIGPFVDGENYSVAKVLDKRNISDSARVRVIVIPTNDIKTEADKDRKLKLIDSLFKAVDTLHLDFGMIAMQSSADRASAEKGGDIGWIYKQQNEWNPEIFNRGGLGKIYKSFTNTEAKIVQIIAYPATIPAVKYGVVSYPLVASAETQKSIYGRASDFAGKSRDLKTMEEAAKSSGIALADAEFGKEEFSIGGMQESCRETIKWAFTNAKNTVSPIQSLGSKKYIVACITGSKTKGKPVFEELKDDLKPIYMNEAKAKKIIEKVGEIKAIADASKAYGNSPMNVTGVSMTSPNLNGSYEGNVAGKLFSMKVNEISKPIKGNVGVFYVQPTRIGEATPTTDLSVAKAQIMMKMQYRQNILESLLNTSKIEDNRINVFQ